ncbi:MAG: hypothetical protein IPK83_02600 [Planctomycetes bacterium]|nr:hypothetical protein [Planctomycetota bacterium]
MPSQSTSTVVSKVVESDAYRVESACLARSGFPVLRQARLFKILDNNLIRLIFPTDIGLIDDGTAVALVCLHDPSSEKTIYAHTVFAGPDSNHSLQSLYNPPVQSKPQPGDAGNRAILKYVEWKKAAWFKFLNDELEFGTARASEFWLGSFWKALDRMYGGGNLLPDALG